MSGDSIPVANYVPGHHMDEVAQINSIVLAFATYLLRSICIHNVDPKSGGKWEFNHVYILNGRYLLNATSTAVYHLPSEAPDGGHHTIALNASVLVDDLSGGCDCGGSPGGQVRTSVYFPPHYTSFYRD